MIHFAKGYFDQLLIFNRQGKEAKLYLIEGSIYKVYPHFNYNEAKVERFKSIKMNHVVLLEDVFEEGDTIGGYKMKYVNGKILNYPHSTKAVIEASKYVSQTVEEMSQYHLVPVDMSIDNTMLTTENQFEFVDTYGYIFYDKLSSQTIYKHNMSRINNTIMCGLIAQDWSAQLKKYFGENILNTEKIDLATFVTDIMTRLDAEFQCADVKQLSKVIKNTRR